MPDIERPSLSHDEIKGVLRDSYGIEEVDEIEPLVSFSDQNFLVRSSADGRELLVKIMNWKSSENEALQDEMNKLMSTLSESVCCPVPLKTVFGAKMAEFRVRVGNQEKTCFVRLFDYIPGSVLEKGKVTCQQSSEWGKLVGDIHAVFQQQTEYPLIRGRNTLFSWIKTPQVNEYLSVLENAEDRALIQSIVSEYEEKILPKLLTYERQILHGDLNDTNVVVGTDGHVKAVLDIFECQGGPFVCDLAVALAYLAITVPDLENNLDDYFKEAADAYAERMPNVLSEYGDIESFVMLICGRIAQSLTLGMAAYKDTGNIYCINTQPRGWKAVRRIFNRRKDFAHVFENAFRGPAQEPTTTRLESM